MYYRDVSRISNQSTPKKRSPTKASKHWELLGRTPYKGVQAKRIDASYTEGAAPLALSGTDGGGGLLTAPSGTTKSELTTPSTGSD